VGYQSITAICSELNMGISNIDWELSSAKRYDLFIFKPQKCTIEVKQNE
jgi:hypothetical protein